MLYEYLVTAFKVFVSILTSEILTIATCVAFGLLIIWILFSLVFSFQSRFSRRCRQISMFVDEKGLSSETYPKFIELASKLPDSFLRGWKTFEHSDKGLPSEYLKRSECLDLELTGGLFNQNRSVMKTYISLIATAIAILSFALVSSTSAITAYVLAEVLVLPFVFVTLSMLTYYLYTALRQRQYRVCVEDFNEMLDILNEKVEYNEIDFDARNVNNSTFIKTVVDPAVENLQPLVVVSDAEETKKDEMNNQIADVANTNETISNPIEENDEYQEVVEEKEADKETNEVVVEKVVETVESTESLTNDENTVEKQEDQAYTQDIEKENVVMQAGEDKVKRGRGRPKKEKAPEGELVIKNDQEFEEVLARAEKLMRKNEEPLSQSQQKRVEKALKELVDAMKKYKGEN